MFEYNRAREKFFKTVAWMLPRELVAWCFSRVVAHATTGLYSDQILPELSVMDAFRRWEDEDVGR